MDKIHPLFTATASAVGGKNGHTETTDGAINADLSVPRELSGEGKPGLATPEHLFAAGYAACFGGALDFVAKQKKRDATGAKITCTVAIGKAPGWRLWHSVNMRVEDPTILQADLSAFVRQAHDRICPYSHATRGNVEVAFEVIGALKEAVV